ncbi:MAG: TIGR02281 family clan AA aspartic protease [Parvularculaceae bacterium]|nr:TIGR02281 family clan AA aspartic protease [Parvularculaceae bacterium]
MRNEFLAAVVCICATVIAVKRFETDRADKSAPAEAAVLTASPVSGAEYHAYATEIRVPASANHQYFVTAAVNSRPASFLIDTGASFVALRDSDARAANIHTSWSDYSHPVRTANGETKAALIDIEMIEIDGIRIRGVKAFILPDDQLSVNLLGMSFLSRLESVEARGGELVLKG